MLIIPKIGFPPLGREVNGRVGKRLAFTLEKSDF